METSEATKRALTSPSRRLEAVPTYMFAELERRVAEKRQAGVDVISLGIGDPDRGTYPHIVQAMRRTQQTSLYLDRLGPFFVGRAVWQSDV